MKRSIPIGAVFGLIAVVVIVIGLVMWRVLNAVPPGPSAEEAMKHTGPDAIREAMAKGPPPGPPPPGGDRNPMLAPKGAKAPRGAG